VVGKGLVESILLKRKVLRRELGLDIVVTAICEREGCVEDENGIDLPKVLNLAKKGKLIHHPNFSPTPTLEVLDKAPADVMIELTPGKLPDANPGREHILKALSKGMHVVTSNKAPLATDYHNLVQVAEKNERKLLFEAAVGGAIPVIRTGKAIKEYDTITSIHGILNGTTNFILDKMGEEGIDLKMALKEAQELGIAEPDPRYDIEGIDSAAKLVILANALMDMKVEYGDVKVEGISEITPEAISLAREHNYVIKLIADVSELRVGPRLVPSSHPLNIKGTLNAIMLKTELAGELSFIGKGAGPKETSSALLSDIIEIGLGS